MSDTPQIDYLAQISENGYCYFRSKLNTHEQIAYDRIRSSLFSYLTSFSINGFSFTQIQDIFQRIKQDNPGLFFIKSIQYQQNSISNAASIIPIYRFHKQKAEATAEVLIGKCKSIIHTLTNATELNKELSVHDMLCKTIIYDYSFAESSFECVGPLLFGKGVCEGISKASKLLFDFLGLKSIVVFGKKISNKDNNIGDNNHAWNIVYIQNTPYHLDVTFNLTVMVFNSIRYDYFNLSDQEISYDHVFIKNDLPICNTSGDYYKYKGLFFKKRQDLIDYLKNNSSIALNDLTFRLPVVRSIEDTQNNVSNIIMDFLNTSDCCKSMFQISYNESQRVFHVHFV